MTDVANFDLIVRNFLQYVNNLLPVLEYSTKQKEIIMLRIKDITSNIEDLEKEYKTYRQMIIDKKMNPGFNPAEINRTIREYKNDKYAMEQNLNNIRGIELMSGVIMSKYPVSPRPVLMACLAGLLGVLAGFFISYLLHYLKNEKTISE